MSTTKSSPLDMLEKPIHALQFDKIVFGPIIGRGNFSSVYGIN